jgi:hypothetical protein
MTLTVTPKLFIYTLKLILAAARSMQNATGGISFDGLKRIDVVCPEANKETLMITGGKIRQLSDNTDGAVQTDDIMLTPPNGTEVSADICQTYSVY